MKKIMNTFFLVCLALGSQAQTEPSTAAQEYRVEIDTTKLSPIEYASQAELELYAPARIEEIKTQLLRDDLSVEARTTFMELLWRFENAVVVTKN